MDNNPDKSKKGEGFVETAKIKGPVDPSRPQVWSSVFSSCNQLSDITRRQKIARAKKEQQVHKRIHKTSLPILSVSVRHQLSAKLLVTYVTKALGSCVFLLQDCVYMRGQASKLQSALTSLPLCISRNHTAIEHSGVSTDTIPAKLQISSPDGPRCLLSPFPVSH